MKYSVKFLVFLIVMGSVHNLFCQEEPYPVHDTKPVIIQEPYLIDPSETGMTVAWLTDTPSQSKVVYAKKGEELTQVAESQKHGLVPVDTKHSIRIDNLEPGATYNYKILSRRVVKLNPYWPDMGEEWIESPTYSFTTFNRKKSKINFSSITDTHEHVDWINKLMDMVDWNHTDFFVHTGDAFNYLQNEDQLFKNWLTPTAKHLNQKTPLVYSRGNHELRGSFARSLFDYVPIHDGNFYYATTNGPAHLLVMDSGEDKSDSTNVYAGLNRLKDYKEEEYKWFKNHVKTSKALKEAPFRIVLMHDPNWGWMDGKNNKWTALANEAKVDLIIAGHWHRFKRFNPGEKDGANFPVLIIGQKQIANVEVTENHIIIEVRDINDDVVDSFKINNKGKLQELD